MNNKGQSLVFFVLLLPVVVIFLFMIITRLMIEYNNNHNRNIIDDTLKIVLKDDIRESEKIDEMIKANINYQTINIDITEEYVNISIRINNNNILKKDIVTYHFCGNYGTKNVINKLCV